MRLLESLASTPDLLERTLADFTPRLLRWVPPDWAAAPAEPFTALATVCHLRDLEVDGYHLRLRRTLAEDRPDLPSVDGFRLERERGYAGEDLARALQAFRQARQETLRLVREWTPEALARQTTFAEYGTVTAAGLLQLLASHDLQHLSGLRWLLARASAAV